MSSALREAPKDHDNYGARGSLASGAAEKAVQALGEQVWVVNVGLETRLGFRVNHPVTTWMIEHSAVLLSKYPVCADGTAGLCASGGKTRHSRT